MKKIIVSLMALAAVLMVLPGTALATDYGKQKVVYHINGGDPQQNQLAMRNIQNHINAVGAENIDLKVVMHGAGLNLLINAKEDENMRASVDNLKMQNVSFQVCNNTLVGRKLDITKDLYDAKAEDVIPSGVAHLSYLQAQGYTYVKP
jgi:intracellular sulfur oxidation DsrE/DsrF family protein